MLEIQTKEGAVFRPSDAGWSILLPNGQAYSWEDVARIALIEVTPQVMDGEFGGMPIKILRFIDASDLVVEIPIPLPHSAQISAMLASKKIEVVRAMPIVPPRG